MFDLRVRSDASPDRFRHGLRCPDLVVGNLRSEMLRLCPGKFPTLIRIFIICYKCHHGCYHEAGRRRVARDREEFMKTNKLPQYVIRTWMRLIW